MLIYNQLPRLLIISHNLYDVTNNVGKTLISLLSKWPKDKISSIYFRNEKPHEFYCKNYYLLDDKAVLKSLFSLGIYKAGESFNSDSLIINSCTEVERKLYQLGNKRNSLVSLSRDIMWHVGFWKNAKLRSWLNEVNPEIILFVPNEYELAFDVLDYVHKIVAAPIITYYMDDVFYYGQKTKGINRYRRHRLLRKGYKCAQISEGLFTTCDLMSSEYNKLFSLQCTDFGNCVNLMNQNTTNDKKGDEVAISYIGNLHSNRWKALIDVGDALSKIKGITGGNPILHIYSASDITEEIKNRLVNNDSIRFEGAISYEEVRKIQSSSDILVHVEAMDEKSKQSTRLSVSTKIFEYLSVGKPIFAYGPDDIASIQYLNNTGAAVIANNRREIEKKLQLLLSSESYRLQLGKNGIDYAKKHCDREKESMRFANALIDYSGVLMGTQ